MPILGNFPGIIHAEEPAYGLKLGSVSGAKLKAGPTSLNMKWTDPDDMTYESKVLAEWAGTKIVYKAGSAPTSHDDGTTVTVTERNQYTDSYLTIDSMNEDVVYYVAFYPFSNEGVYGEPLILSDTTGYQDLPAPTNVSATASGTSVILKWDDPDDVVEDDVLMAQWSNTIVRWSTSSYPTYASGGSGGIIIWDRDNYKTNGYTVTGLIANTTYYFSFFSVRSDGTAFGSVSARVSAKTIQLTTISAYPSQKNTLTYTGSAQTPTWNNYSTTQLTIGGATSGTNAKTYYATFTPKSGYCWSDGSTDAVSVAWTIGRATIPSYPTATNTSLEYNGSAQGPTFNYNSSYMAMSGDTSKTNVGSYTAKFTPKSNYKWANGTTSAYTISWSINKRKITLPSQSGTLTYNGSYQTPSWNSNYNSKYMTVSVESQVNAGAYYATFTPTSSCVWSDGTTVAKAASWKIVQAENDFTITPSSAEFNDNCTEITVKITTKFPVASLDWYEYGSAGIVSNCVISGSESNWTAVVYSSGTAGECSLYFTSESTTNVNLRREAVLISALFLPEVGAALSNYSWSEIRIVSDAELGPNYWSVGDGKPVHINGDIEQDGGSVRLNYELWAVILGFNHNADLEGYKRIHFWLAYDASYGRNATFVDDGYDQYNYFDENALFCMNPDLSNDAGWGGANSATAHRNNWMRTNILPQFQGIMPADLQAVLKTVTKYTDNVGGGNGNRSSYVTPTTETLFLLSEYELYRMCVFSNGYESNYQEIYELFMIQGSNSINNLYDFAKLRRCGKSTRINWWLRSPVANVDPYEYGTYLDPVSNREHDFAEISFCLVDTNGEPWFEVSDFSRGLSVCFCV